MGRGGLDDLVVVLTDARRLRPGAAPALLESMGAPHGALFDAPPPLLDIILFLVLGRGGEGLTLHSINGVHDGVHANQLHDP